MKRQLRTRPVKSEIQGFSLKLDHMCYISTSGFVIEDVLQNIYECSEDLVQHSRGFTNGVIRIESGDFDLFEFTIFFTFSIEDSGLSIPLRFGDSIWLEVFNGRIKLRSHFESFFEESIEDLGGFFSFCMTRAGRSATVYINGTRRGEFGVTMLNAYDLTLGAQSRSFIDRIYIYERRLSDQQVDQLHSSFVFPSYWQDGLGTIASDQLIKQVP